MNQLTALIALLFNIYVFCPHGANAQTVERPECSNFSKPLLTGSEILSITSQEMRNVSKTAMVGIDHFTITGLNFCDVNVTYMHPEIGDKILVRIWLPLDNWNGRFRAMGGSGWIAGIPSGMSLAAATAQGYATATSDGGNLGIFPLGTLSEDNVYSKPGEINYGKLANFASRSPHELAIIGKTITENYYGTAPHHSYWDGCSNGGRQGYVLAQKYPTDFDGILATAPGLYWPNFMLGLGWARLLQESSGHFPSPCEFKAFQDASIKACDELDGVSDGIISDLSSCQFDPYTLVGTTVDCDGHDMTISNETAEIVAKTREGPRSMDGRQLFDGYDYGIPYDGITGAEAPELFTKAWIRHYIKKDPGFNCSTLNVQEFSEFFGPSYLEYGGIIGAESPDLSAFRDHGGKLLTWHGMADELLMINNTIRYRKQVESTMGGNALVNDFYKLFFPPGVGHCGGGYGPVPKGEFDALVSWVEEGNSPDTLSGMYQDVNAVNATRNICSWPLVAKYDGKGNHSSADSYTCKEAFT